MSEPFIGEIKIVGFNFAPRGFAFCNGQLLPIAQYTALFSILGTTFGGNGQTTFALPNLQGRIPRGVGQGPGLTDCDWGEASGAPEVTLLQSQMPMHTHTLRGGLVSPANPAQNSETPTTSAMFGLSTPGQAYNTESPSTTFSPQMMGLAGGTQSHENRQPLLVLNFVIAMVGLYPSRN